MSEILWKTIVTLVALILLPLTIAFTILGVILYTLSFLVNAVGTAISRTTGSKAVSSGSETLARELRELGRHQMTMLPKQLQYIVFTKGSMMNAFMPGPKPGS